MSDMQANTQNGLLDSLLGDFLDESDQLLTQLNERLLQLDDWARAIDDRQQQCDPTLLNEMFRAAHSLKGLSAMLGLTDINRLTHKIENVFDAARRNELTVNGDVTELIFKGLDQLAALIELLKDPQREPVDCTAVVDAIRILLQTAGVEKKQSSQAEAERLMGEGTAENLTATERERDDVTSVPVPVAAREGSPLTSPSAAAPTEEVKRERSISADPLADIRDEGEISQKYLSIFIDESEASLDDLTSTLLALELGGKGDVLKGLMGTAHKIKGSAASIGLNRIAKLAHLMEDVLQELAERHASLSAEATDVFLRCIDALQRYVAELKHGTAQSDHFGQLARELLAVQSPGLVVETPSRQLYVGNVRFQPSLPAVGLKASLIYEKLAKLGDLSRCEPNPESFDAIEQLDCFRFQLATDQPLATIKDRLRIAGVLEATVAPCPILTSAEAQSASTTIAHLPAKNRQGVSAEISSVLPGNGQGMSVDPPASHSGDRRDMKVDAIATPPAETAKGKPIQECEPRAADAGQRPTETVRVDIDRLDHLMDLAGQLVINKAQFTQIGDRFRSVLGCKHSEQALSRVSIELERMDNQIALRPDGQHSAAAVGVVRGSLRRIQNELEPLRREVEAFRQAREFVENLSEAIHQLGRVSDGIQQSVMDTRMVPIGPLFARFKRVVRDITRSTGKQARLDIHGEGTELDKRMIDELNDPLVHLVRNSVDHGIESPEARDAAGKPREGTVTLDASHRGNSIVIEVRDDGKGLDADLILQKCLEKGLVTKADAEKMTTQQIYQKIWEPGLSTAEKVTEVSGRGMGMDIVKSKIDNLNGTAEIDSAPGKGTTITIKLPLTLAILPSLMVEIRGDVFAIPMEAVVEIVNVAGNQMTSVHGRQMARVRGRVVSLLRLGDLLSFHGDDPQAATQTTETTLVVVGEAGQEVGLAVDRVLREEEVVIKSIAENFANVLGIAGASILGDGRVSLILDIAALVGIVAQQTACATH
jgi:two-component system chemotaxis sensor kinase CheA